ncbi:MAG: T9SS type A sorting domain-containing protein [Bacteroidetes bacterium]|nr:T9SS type A sorting domain-containing protein [Bacteroidota bacterium]
MKKNIYLAIFTFISVASQAQLTLTKAFNDPIYGDQFNRKEFDSVGVVPKSTGTNQLWNFSAYPQNANVLNTTFTTVSTAPNGANYIGATIVEMDGAGANSYYKSTASTYELVGAENTSLSYNYTNTAMGWAWPTAYGYTNTDTYSGSAATSSSVTGTAIGSNTVNASGTGTLILPGGITFNNVLQLTIRNTFTLNYASSTFVLNINAVDYDYFAGAQKLPIFTVSYSSVTGSSSSSSAKIRVNNLALTGLNDHNFDAAFAIFPNPAKDHFSIKLSNPSQLTCNIEIINSIGQKVQLIKLGSDAEISGNINIADFATGIYTVKTTLGSRISCRKLVVE